MHEFISIVFDRCYFAGNFKYLRCSQGCTLSKQEISSHWYYLSLKFVRFFDGLYPIFIGNRNICKITLVVSFVSKNEAGTKFELKFVFF